MCQPFVLGMEARRRLAGPGAAGAAGQEEQGAPTCVDRYSGLANDQLRGHGRGGPQLVQPLGHLQDLAGRVEPVQEPVAHEQDGRCSGVVPGEDGGPQGHLEVVKGHRELVRQGAQAAEKAAVLGPSLGCFLPNRDSSKACSRRRNCIR